MCTGIVEVLHEAGALVCVEGIENEAEGLCATDADADLMQGNFFARPAEKPPAENACDDLFARLLKGLRAETAEFNDHRRTRPQPYIAALSDALLALSDGWHRVKPVPARV